MTQPSSETVGTAKALTREKPSTHRFAFGGAVGTLCREYFDRDVAQARLSAKFKLYYRLRPFIPISLRQMLQRGRNQGFGVPDDWYLPTEFVRDLRKALVADADAVAVHPWPDGYQISCVLTHDVETKMGLELVDQLATVEEQFGFRSSWNIVPYLYDMDLGLIADLKGRGHEIGVHGYNHDGRLFESQRTFKRRAGPINQALANFGSEGFRSPMVHRNLKWIGTLNVDYDSSCFDIDPFQAMPGGVGAPWPFFSGKFVELPYTLPQDHTLLVSLMETSPRIWIEKIEFLRGIAGMALLVTHPDYLDTPGRLDVYRRLLEHLAEQHDIWHALPREVSDWWRQRDQIQIDSTGDTLQLVGPSADRARVMALSDLQPG